LSGADALLPEPAPARPFSRRADRGHHDIDLPPGLIDQVKAVLPPGFEAASVEIIFRGKAPSKA
jgi:hypothetical protein